MAEEDDDKDKDKPQTERKRRKALPALLLVVLGAGLGGAGVVFLAPRPAPEPEGPPPEDIRLYDHPEVMEFTFNPITERGHHQARIDFVFTYKADSRDVEVPEGQEAAGSHAVPPVLLAIKTNWSRAYSRCLEVLSKEKTSSLMDPDGKRRLKRRLIDELTATLFPNGIATVDDILWRKFFVQ